MNVKVEILWLVQLTGLILNAAAVKVELERGEVFEYDPKFMYKPRVWVGHYNRTQKVLNGDFNFRRPLEDDGKLVFESLKFMSNEYRHVGIKFEATLKDVVFKNDTFKILSLVEHEILKRIVDPQLSWPLKTNVTYKLRNLSPDNVRTPPLPDGGYLVKISLYRGNKQAVILAGGFYVQITYPIVF